MGQLLAKYAKLLIPVNYYSKCCMYLCHSDTKIVHVMQRDFSLSAPK